MELPHRRSVIYDRVDEKEIFEKMKNFENWKSYPSYNRIKDILRKPMEVEKVEIVPSFMFGLFTVFNELKEQFPNSDTVLVPDQGGWSGYMELAEQLNLEYEKYDTTLGILKEIDIHEQVLAVIVPNFPGYIAKNNMNKVTKMIGDKSVLVNDASSGYFEGFGDIVLASFGAPKIVNGVTGGVIGTSEDLRNDLKPIINTGKVHPFNLKAIDLELSKREKILDLIFKYSNMLKEFLIDSGINVAHENRKSMSVGILSDQDSDYLYDKLRTDMDKSLVTNCPLYERYDREGYVIELKKLDLFEIDEKDILRIGELIKDVEK